MPIARDFFPTFQKLDISANPWVLVEGLLGYLQQMRNISDPSGFLSSGIDIEALHTEIEEDRDRRMFPNKGAALPSARNGAAT
jgi:hypothetical protein